jgi:predicted transcriptional regulator
MSRKSGKPRSGGLRKSVNTKRAIRSRPVKHAVASQLATAMERAGISKTRMAALLKTSRSQVDRLLDPKRDVTLGTLQRAAELMGKRVVVELV